MAIYKLHDDVDQFYGSLIGATFQRCCMVFAIRKKNMPTRKVTAKTTRVRNRFGAFASQWRNRSGTQKNSFNSRENLYPRVNSLGNTYYVTGQNLYVSSNISAGFIAMGAINDLQNPASPPSSTVNLIAVRYANLAADFILFPVLVPAGFNLLTFVSPPVSPGRTSFPREEMRLLSNINPSNNTNFNQFPAYRNLYGMRPESVGSKVFVEFHFIQRVTGQLIHVLSDFGYVEA